MFSHSWRAGLSGLQSLQCAQEWGQNEVSDTGKRSKNDPSQGLSEPEKVNRVTRVVT